MKIQMIVTFLLLILFGSLFADNYPETQPDPAFQNPSIRSLHSATQTKILPSSTVPRSIFSSTRFKPLGSSTQFKKLPSSTKFFDLTSPMRPNKPIKLRPGEIPI